MQRAGLYLVNGVVFAGFASHCDFYNYTGWVVGMSTSGQILTAYVTTGGPGANRKTEPGPVAEEVEEFVWVDQLLHLTVLVGFSLILEMD